MLRGVRQKLYALGERASAAETVALSLITSLYVRFGSDAQLDAIYHKWHTGHWRRGDPAEPCSICGIF